jgi:glutamate racemase
MRTKLIEIRKPSKEEKEKSAEIVFVRLDRQGNEHTILGCTCYESWEQWGVTSDILGDNVEDIEQWRNELNLI